jgi:uncharacterized protein (TIGR03118 family)
MIHSSFRIAAICGLLTFVPSLAQACAPTTKIDPFLAVSSAVREVAIKQERAYAFEPLVGTAKACEGFTRQPKSIDPRLVNAWGIAIRPKGAGGHFWVTAKNISFEYVGDVRGSSTETLRTLHTDDLKTVTLPVGGEDKFATGTVFNTNPASFVITQTPPKGDPITAGAKFLFASDGGVISAWTERKKPDGAFDWPDHAVSVIDQSSNGAQYFGVTLNAAGTRLYAADFGAVPSIQTFDAAFKPLPIQFDAPFDDNKNGKVDAGEYAPFNIQAISRNGQTTLFVSYAKTQECTEEGIKLKACEKGELFAGEEDTTKKGYGRLAEFTEDGKLIAVWKDGGNLNAPWGVTLAPKNFGAFSEHLLVSNFGDGTIAAFDPQTRTFKGYLTNASNQPIMVEKIWGILFGNGESLGDNNALYVAAGPNDEKDGVFGVIRLEK